MRLRVKHAPLARTRARAHGLALGLLVHGFPPRRCRSSGRALGRRSRKRRRDGHRGRDGGRCNPRRRQVGNLRRNLRRRAHQRIRSHRWHRARGRPPRRRRVRRRERDAPRPASDGRGGRLPHGARRPFRFGQPRRLLLRGGRCSCRRGVGRGVACRRRARLRRHAQAPFDAVHRDEGGRSRRQGDE
jgi:hypothetical protein